MWYPTLIPKNNKRSIKGREIRTRIRRRRTKEVRRKSRLKKAKVVPELPAASSDEEVESDVESAVSEEEIEERDPQPTQERKLPSPKSLKVVDPELGLTEKELKQMEKDLETQKNKMLTVFVGYRFYLEYYSSLDWRLQVGC